MKTFIITGANGFVGNNLIRQINATCGPDAEVRAIVRSRAHAASLTGLDCRIFEGDVTKPDSLSPAFDVPAAQAQDVKVIHCAGIIDISPKPNPHLLSVNVVGTENVIAATSRLAERTGVPPTFIYVSSVHAIPEKPHGQTMAEPDRVSPDAVVGQYAMSKAAATQIVMDAFAEGAVRGCIVFPSGIIGPFDFSPESMKRLVAEVAHGKLPACVQGGYDFVDVRDVANGILAASERGRNGEGYILSNRVVPIKEICDDVCDFVGRPHLKIVLPVSVARAFAPASELYYQLRHRVPLFTSYALHTLQANATFSHEKATRDLGYATRSLQETVFDMVAWMETQPGWNA